MKAATVVVVHSWDEVVGHIVVMASMVVVRIVAQDVVVGHTALAVVHNWAQAYAGYVVDHRMALAHRNAF